MASGEAGGWRVTAIRYAGDLADTGFRARWAPFRHLHLIDSSADPTSHPAGDLWQQVRLPRLLGDLSADVLYSPAYVAPLLSGRCRRVLMVHDDLVWSHPDSYPLPFRMYIRVAGGFSARRSDGVVFPSEDARLKAGGRLSLPVERTAAVPHGVDLELFPPAGLEGRGRLVVCVATAERRKNHDVLLRAMRGRDDVKLLFIGFSERAKGRLAELRGIDRGGNWKILPVADEETISRHLREAGVFVLPSRGEGFGLPVIEAMASGTPMVLSDLEVLREVAGETAVYREPDDAAGWAEAIDEALGAGDGVRERVRAGLERVRGFTLEESARRLLGELRRAYASAS